MKRTRYQYGRVEPSPRANGPDVWVYRWREANPDGTSSRKSAIVGTVEEHPTQAQALRAAEHMRLAANPDNPNGRLISFGALIDRYIAEEMPQRFSTRAAYRSYLGRYIKPKWAKYSISAVKPFAVRAWLKDLPLAPKSQAHIRNLLSVLFSCAMLWELIEVKANPMKLVKIPGATKREEEPRVLTVEEFNKLLAQIEGEPYRTMVVLAMCLGLRCSELIGLQWQDFDWEDLTLLVQRAVVASHVDRVKTRYSKKNLPLDPGLAEILLSWHRQTAYSAQEDWVFASPFMDGRLPYRSWGIQQRHLRPAGIKAGLGPIGWHDLAPYLPDATGRDRRSNLCPTGAYAARGHRDHNEHLRRFGGGEPAKSQQQGGKPVPHEEERLTESNLSSSSISGLLDLFGPARNLNRTHSAKENWRREWDSKRRRNVVTTT